MNVFDRLAMIINPEKGLRRLAARNIVRVMNTGYGDGGASTAKKSMRGWTARSISPEEDIDANLYTLRGRCRDLDMNAPLGRAALRTTRTNVIGSGLRLKSRIDAAFLGLTEEEADAWEQNTEREFDLWARSLHCDALKMNNFYELQQIAQLGWIMNGDAFVLLKFGDVKPYMPYGLRLHLIEGDRVCNPNVYGSPVASGVLSVETRNPDNGNLIVSGVEIDGSGAAVAYHVASKYPYSYTRLDTPLTWTRVPAFGERTGRPNILHLMDCERAEQRRGVPMLAPVVEQLKQVSRYSEAELMAAVVSSMFTVFIKTASPAEMPLGSAIPVEQQVAPEDPAAYEMGSGAINVLGPDESIEVANPQRPNTAFDGFVNALCRQIGAALEIPQELLQKSFQSSYSASRAALLEAWKMFRMRRTWFANDFCQPVYEEWLAEAIARGRITAPGFFDDPAKRSAWSAAEWNGPAPGQVDPLKEANAAVVRINNGLSTRERETMELTGGDFDRNVTQLKREQQIMQEVQGDGQLIPDRPEPFDPDE